MTDVNEIIAKQYYESKGYLVRTNLMYKVKREKGTGDSDIDLVMYNPGTNDRIIAEVKGWYGTRLTPSYVKEYDKSLFGFVSEEALNVAKNIFGNDSFRKILIITEFPAREDVKREVINTIKSRGVDEIKLFKDILKELIDSLDVKKYYRDSEFLNISVS